MSSCTWINYGYGFCLKNVTITKDVKKLDKFLDYAPEYKGTVLEAFNDWDITEPTLENYEELDQDYNLGIASLIKEVLNEYCGLNIFSSCGNHENDKYVMYCRDFPWNMSEAEKELTEEKLNEIMSIVKDILEDPEKLSFGEVEAENWG